MHRKKVLFTILTLYATAGIIACLLYNNPLFVAIGSDHTIDQASLLPAQTQQTTEEEIPSTALEASTEPETSIEEETSTEPETSIEEETSTEPETIVEEPDYTYTAIHSTGRLFIRNGPSLDYDIISFMRPGTTGDVISLKESDEWVLLRYNDIEGFVFKGYLELTEKEDED